MPSSLNWSKRVPLETIKRLYESDASGLLDEDLLDRVGHGLYVRCSDLFEFWRARNGEITCRQCGHLIRRRAHATHAQDDLAEKLRCKCGWQLTWGDYLKRSQGHQLGASDVHLLVQHFMDRWPKCRKPQDKLLLIDWLIHQFHVKLVGMGNLFGVNMLSGSPDEVLSFLNSLAYGDNEPHQKLMGETQKSWKQAQEICRNNKADLVRMGQRLGIKDAAKMHYEALAHAILQIAPDEFQDIDKLLDALTKGLRKKTLDVRPTTT
jgi:hypothetical protein